MMQILGNVAGYVIGGIAVALDQYALGLIALGILELVTMLSVVIRVREGPTAEVARRAAPWRGDRRRGVGHGHPPASGASCGWSRPASRS